MIQSKSTLLGAIGALLLAVGIIVVLLKQGPTEMVKINNDVPVVENGTWPSDEVRQETINQTSKGYQITAMYPVAQSSAVSAYFRTFIDDTITAFKEDTAWALTDTTSVQAENLALDISYTRSKNDLADNYVFQVGSYTGGAHGVHATKTFSFSPEGKLLTSTELFTNGNDGLKTVAPYVQKELLKFDFAEKTWVEEGTAPEESNYQNFIIESVGITFIFDPYQVAYYAAGEQRITVPLSVFKSIASKDIFK